MTSVKALMDVREQAVHGAGQETCSWSPTHTLIGTTLLEEHQQMNGPRQWANTGLRR